MALFVKMSASPLMAVVRKTGTEVAFPSRYGVLVIIMMLGNYLILFTMVRFRKKHSGSSLSK